MADLSTTGFTGGQVPPSAPFVNPTGPVGGSTGSILPVFSSIFAGAAKFAKDSADDEVPAVITDLGSQMGKLNDAVTQGTITPAEATSRMRAASNSALASSPQHAEGINKVLNAFGKHTEVGEALEDEKDLLDTNRAIRKEAMEGGWINDEMTTEQQDVATEAMIDHKKAQASLKEERATAAEAREAASAGRAAADWTSKWNSRNDLNVLVDTSYTKFQGQTSSLIARMQRGDDPTQLIQLLDQQMATVQKQSAALAKGDAGYASTALAPFETTYKATMDFLTGQTDKKATENALATALARSKMQLIANSPGLRQVVATSQLLGNSLSLVPRVEEEVIKIIKRASPNPMDEDQGSARTANDIWKLNVKGVATGGISEDSVKEEASSYINKQLKGVQAYSLAVEDPKQYNQVYDLIASPEMATAVQKGMVDGEASLSAKQVLAREWESEAVRSLDADMKKRISGAAIFGGGALQVGGTQDITDVVVPTFRGSGVTFVPSGSALIAGSRVLSKDKPAREQAAIEARSRRLDQFISGLQTGAPSKLLNKMIKAGAHLEGHTDYEKYWEANKQLLLPTFFMDKEDAANFLERGILPQEQKEAAGIPTPEIVPKPEGAPQSEAAPVTPALKAIMIEGEGESLTAYDSPEGGTQTIGVGHKLTTSEDKFGIIVINGEKVEWKGGLTQEQSDALLIQDLIPAKNAALKSLKKVEDFSEEQLNAVTSLIFNVGETAWNKSKAKKALERGDFQEFLVEAFDEKKGFTRIKGKISRGLRNRRSSERELFITDRPELGPDEHLLENITKDIFP